MRFWEAPEKADIMVRVPPLGETTRTVTDLLVLLLYVLAYAKLRLRVCDMMVTNKQTQQRQP